MKNKSKKIKQQ